MAVSDAQKIPLMTPAHFDDIAAQMRGEVLADAARVFGYKADSFNALGPLATLLASLDIMPRDRVGVMEYKKRRTRKYRTRWNMSLGWAGVVVALAYWSLVAYATHFNGWMLAVGLALSIAAMVHGWACGDSLYREHATVVYWKEIDLLKYARYVPVHVLSKALQIQKANPQVAFVIHELCKETTEIMRPLPDPFLEVKYGAESYFIEVWDERNYRAKD